MVDLPLYECLTHWLKYRLNIAMITDKPVLPVGELHNLRSLEVKGLQRDEDGWTLYWSDGNRLITHQTDIQDKRTAGEVLDNMLLNYIQDKGERGRMEAITSIIRTTSKTELAELSDIINDEMEIRGMKGDSIGWRLPRRGIRRAKGLISRYYDRVDIDE